MVGAVAWVFFTAAFQASFESVLEAFCREYSVERQDNLNRKYTDSIAATVLTCVWLG